MATAYQSSLATARASRLDQRHRFLFYLAASSTFLLLFAVFLAVLRVSVELVVFLLSPLICFWCLSILLFFDELKARPGSSLATHPAATIERQPVRGCSPAEKPLLPALLLTPIWTLALLKPFVFQLYATVVNSRAKRDCRTRTMEKFPNRARWFLLLFCGVYALSLLIHAGNAQSAGRVFGGLYNLSIWVMGLLLLAVLAKVGTLQGLERWLRGLTYFGVLASSFACIGLLAWQFGVLTLQITSPLLLIVPRVFQQPALRDSAWISFVYPGWFFSQEPRSASIVNYGTSFGFVMVATILATIHVARRQHWSFFRLFLFLSPQVVGLVLSQARVAVVALFLAGVHTLFYAKRRKALLLLGISIVVGGALWFSYPQDVLDLGKSFTYAARGGSATDRLAIYAADIAMWRQNPLLGFGYKLHEWGNLAYPLGSHSTYLGILLKTGVLGLGSFLAFLFALYAKWRSSGRQAGSTTARGHWLYLGATLVLFVTAMLTEDLDATQVLPFIFFITAGYTLALVRLAKQPMILR